MTKDMKDNSAGGVRTIRWDDEKNEGAVLIDQTLLPGRLEYITIRTPEQMWEAIKMLRIRGAPAIGVAGAYGSYIGIRDYDGDDVGAFMKKLKEVNDYLDSSRPTAVNLAWALRRMYRVAEENTARGVSGLKNKLLETAREIEIEDLALCHAIGDHGAALIPDDARVLTHCNAGGLATAGYGTALGVIRSAVAAGKKVEVFADETRPLLQGARLTAWELGVDGIPVTLISDNMAAVAMRDKGINCVVTGADRIAANGDAANKIGTYGVALLAKAHGIPFYIAAPSSTFDLQAESGKDIPIEERDPEEVRNFGGTQTAPADVNVFNPAFDVTPAELITAIITEKGIIKPPYVAEIQKILGSV
jgi:methylthioribose-1-phosphate isomerase